MSELISDEEIKYFNQLINKLISVNYVNPYTYENNKLEIDIGTFFIVKNLRKFNKIQLKKLFYYIGGKQVMNISSVATAISLKSIETNDYESISSPWKIIC